MAKQQILRFKPAPRFEQAASNLPSALRTANIALNHEMILSYDANPAWIEFSERTGRKRVVPSVMETAPPSNDVAISLFA
jgi:hypothetical protein